MPDTVFSVFMSKHPFARKKTANVIFGCGHVTRKLWTIYAVLLIMVAIKCKRCNMKFEEKLVKLRKEHKLSQEQLAEKLGVSRQAISRWEAGETTPDMANLLGLCDAFGVSADYLIREGEVPQIQNQTGETVTKTPDQRKKIAHLVFALCAQFAMVSFVVGVCYSYNIVQKVLLGACAGLMSAVNAFLAVRAIMIREKGKNKPNQRKKIAHLLSALCAQVAMVSFVVGVCYSNNIIMQLLLGLCAGLMSAVMTFQVVHAMRS